MASAFAFASFPGVAELERKCVEVTYRCHTDVTQVKLLLPGHALVALAGVLPYSCCRESL